MDIVYKNTKAYLKGFAENQLIQYFLESYNESRARGGGKYSGITSPVRSSGRGGESLSVETDGDSIHLVGEGYLKYVDEGTSGGKFPNIEALKRWITEKPVSLNDVKGSSLESKRNRLAFLIGRSIKKDGIAPASYITEVVERAMPDIADGIGEHLVEDVRENLEKIMIGLGYQKKGNQYILATK
jgi:hypothetical protein